MLSDVAQTLQYMIRHQHVPCVGRCLWLYGDREYAPDICDIYHPQSPNQQNAGVQGLLSDLENGQQYDCVYLCVPKQTEEMLGLIAFAFSRIKTGGYVVIAGANNAGGARLPQLLKQRGVLFDSYSKNKCRVVCIKGGSYPLDDLAFLSPRPVLINGDEFYSVPGLFSWDRADAGSQYLLDHLPALAGVGVDLGCGFGYLTCSVLSRFAGVTTMHAVDIDARAVDCLQKTATLHGLENRVVTYWDNVTALRAIPDGRADFVVMNPPFHTGQLLNIELGQNFVRAGMRCLKKGGVLYCVANRHLPYENIFQSCANIVQVLGEDKGYKIIQAVA